MIYLNTQFRQSFVLLVLFAAFANLAFGQDTRRSAVSGSKNISARPEAAAVPVIFDGQNITCADLNASTDIRFAHITQNYELKLNFSDPNGSFAFTTGSGSFVEGPENGTRSVTVSSGSATVYSWSSQISITAVNVKIGNTSYVYPYAPSATSDSNLATGDHRGISHMTFCFGNAIAPTAGEGSVSGRVVDSSGVGIASATMTVVNAATGETTSVRTNASGYYTVGDLRVGELYMLHIAHKRYKFAEQERVVTLNDSLADIDFTANP